MVNDEVARLPDHLAPLLEPTPSSVAKLIAAWDGLNIESQVLLLTELDKVGLPDYLNEKILVKALGSANAYVRYLAASRFTIDDTAEKKAIIHRIQEDPDPLVRYCVLESGWGSTSANAVGRLGSILRDQRALKDADAFFALPQEARLAKVTLMHEYGEDMAALISHAVDHQLKEGKVSEIELFESQSYF